MWCDRCPTQDRASLGTDEHPHPAWLVLCGRCAQELTEDQAAIDDEPAEYQRRLATRDEAPVTRSRRSWADALPQQKTWRRHYENDYHRRPA
jgi:hypothetical protein